MKMWDTIDRYMILSSDTHAGAEMRRYNGESLITLPLTAI